MKIRKGDEVEVLIGKDRTKRGTVMRVLPKEGKVIVEGINRAKKHQRQTQVRVKGGIIDKDLPINVSSVGLVCPKDGAVRVGFEIKPDGSKVRVCKVCGREL
ncbi:MAG TPA: 50S ribosomal protein L24 [Acidimicrobiales bacterium]|nr:50S ribosomal protein L24 [Acidimicrobiales bacterium]